MLIDNLQSPSDGHVEINRATNSFIDNNRLSNIPDKTNQRQIRTPSFYGTATPYNDTIPNTGKFDKGSTSKVTNESCGW